VVQYPGSVTRQNRAVPTIDVRTVTEPAQLPFADVLSLYESVGWTVYTRDPERIRRALAGASYVAAAFAGERLVGIVRAISDDVTITYLQDLLVHPDAQRSGVGASLMTAVGQRYAHVRQHVLLTDDEPGQRAFYENVGFAETRDFGDGSLRAFVRFG
jgi:GNAT superfamily N-acetyltransferase